MDYQPDPYLLEQLGPDYWIDTGTNTNTDAPTPTPQVELVPKKTKTPVDDSKASIPAATLDELVMAEAQDVLDSVETHEDDEPHTPETIFPIIMESRGFSQDDKTGEWKPKPANLELSVLKHCFRGGKDKYVTVDGFTYMKINGRFEEMDSVRLVN